MTVRVNNTPYSSHQFSSMFLSLTACGIPIGKKGVTACSSFTRVAVGCIADESTGDFNYQHGLHSSHHKKLPTFYEASSGSGTFWDRFSTVNAQFYNAGFQGVRHIAQKKLTELSCERRECEPKYLHVRFGTL
jgi:hypothetical protein